MKNSNKTFYQRQADSKELKALTTLFSAGNYISLSESNPKRLAFPRSINKLKAISYANPQAVIKLERKVYCTLSQLIAFLTKDNLKTLSFPELSGEPGSFESLRSFCQTNFDELKRHGGVGKLRKQLSFILDMMLTHYPEETFKFAIGENDKLETLLLEEGKSFIPQGAFADHLVLIPKSLTTAVDPLSSWTSPRLRLSLFEEFCARHSFSDSISHFFIFKKSVLPDELFDQFKLHVIGSNDTEVSLKLIKMSLIHNSEDLTDLTTPRIVWQTFPGSSQRFVSSLIDFETTYCSPEDYTEGVEILARKITQMHDALVK